MAKMTKAQRGHMAKLERAVNAAIDAVYKAAPNDQTPFSGCYAAASPDVRKAYDDAKAAVLDYEFKMVNEQRGWIENGRFRDYGDPYGLRRYGEAD